MILVNHYLLQKRLASCLVLMISKNTWLLAQSKRYLIGHPVHWTTKEGRFKNGWERPLRFLVSGFHCSVLFADFC